MGEPTPEALESLASLLTVVGPTFDVQEWSHHIMLTVVFSKVEELIKMPHITARVRCLFQDVLDLRAANWNDRKPKKIEGPSTLGQVAQKFHAEVDTPQAPTRTNSAGARLLALVAAPRATSSSAVCPASTASSPDSSSEAPSPSKHMFSVHRRPAAPSSPTPLTGDAPSPFFPNEPARSAPRRSTQGGKIERTSSDQNAVRGPGAAAAKKNSNMSRLVSDLWAGGPAKSEGANTPLPHTTTTTSSSSPTWKPSLNLGDLRKRPTKVVAGRKFDKEACRTELMNALAELKYSHEVKEAVACIAAVEVPTCAQPEELSELLGAICGEGSDVVRKVGFQLVENLFSEGHWQCGLLAGLRCFAEMCADLKCDVPTLPRIIREELQPALEPLVKMGLLGAHQLASFAEEI